MKKVITLLATAACAWSAPAAAAPLIAPCPNDRGMVSVVDVQTEFARRSVEIVTLAAKGDEVALDKLVSPTAEFTLWEGDVGWAPREALHGRGNLSGVRAARAFAGHLGAASFEFMVSSTGPIGTDPCGKQSAEVTFVEASGGRGYTVRFDYFGGRLVRAEGHVVSVTRGTVDHDR